MISKGYTLWLMPKAKVYNKYSELIKKLSREYGGPIFEPHVTLLGSIELSEGEIIKKTAQLVKNQKPFLVTLRQIDYEDFYFRTLFVRAEITEALQSLHNKAKEIFEIDIPPFMAHLSILYGSYPQGVKEKIISEIGRDQSAQFKINSIHLVRGGEVQDWKIVREFPFQF